MEKEMAEKKNWLRLRDTGGTRYFFFIVATVLFLAGLVHICGALGPDWMLNYADGLLSINGRYVIISAAVIEIAVSAFLCLSNNVQIKGMLIGWVGSIYLAHFLCLCWMKSPNALYCFGDWPGNYLFSARASYIFNMAFTLVMAIGGYTIFVLRCWRQRKKRPAETITPLEISPGSGRQAEIL
jgi:hypothetical protein